MQNIVAHETTSVAVEENPANSFSHSITGIEDTRDVAKKNIASGLPVLNSKVADVNVMRAFSRNASIDHLDTGFVILVDHSWSFLLKTKFLKDRS